MTNKLKAFPIVIQTEVEWADLDLLGHINNTVFFRYFENARVRYLAEIGLMNNTADATIGPILAKTACTFFKPVKFPETLKIGARIEVIGNTHFAMKHAVVDSVNDLVAEGEGIVVVYDYRAAKKTRIPDELIRSIERLEGCSPGSKCVDVDLEWDGYRQPPK